MFIQSPHLPPPPPRPQFRRLPDSIRQTPVMCTGRGKPHWSVRAEFKGFSPTTRFNLSVPPQMAAEFVCPVCGARELIGADFRTGTPRRLGGL